MTAASIRPSQEMIRYVTGMDDYDDFLRSGIEVFIQLDLAARRYDGRPIREFNRVLDFGCGPGRILQFLQPGPDVFACDVSGPVVKYAELAFPRVNVHCNSLLPPLRYYGEFFDLVYSFSVFSHLSQSVEDAWLTELRRIGQSGCLYLLTVHGDWVIEATLGKEGASARRGGFYYKVVHQRNGTNFDFPDYYETSYHTSDYIKSRWNRWFEVLAIIKGDDPSRHLFGDLQFAPTGTVPLFRPMGQDLVVMRKR